MVEFVSAGPAGGSPAPRRQAGKGIMGHVALVVLAGSWLLLLTVLALDFTGVWRRGTAWRWQGTGLLVMNSAALAYTFAQTRGWSYTRLDMLDSVTFPVTLAGGALFVIGVVVLFKTTRSTW
jgi:hypothetical protein